MHKLNGTSNNDISEIELLKINEKEIRENYKSKNFFNKSYIFIFICSYYLYYLSLEKCFQGFDECGTKNEWISLKLSEAIISSFILSILIEAMIYKKI